MTHFTKTATAIHHILTCHEQGAAHAADGFARATGKVGVCLATSGPGATNLVTGIATAYMDSIPMVAITGNVGTSLIGRGTRFQEVYIAGHHHADHQAQLRRAPCGGAGGYPAQRVPHRHVGPSRPGAGRYPKDVTSAECEFIPAEPVEVHENYDIAKEQLETIADMIAQAERPVIYYGGGVETADAGDALLELMRKADIPLGPHHDGHRLHPGQRSAQSGHDRYARHGVRGLGG